MISALFLVLASIETDCEGQVEVRGGEITTLLRVVSVLPGGVDRPLMWLAGFGGEDR
jgi:hypothetical protein